MRVANVKYRLGCGVAALTLASASSAFAFQDAAVTRTSPDTADASSLEEIVVTALRRGTAVQRTPLPITALTGETLSATGATDISDYFLSVPGLNLVDSGPGSKRIVVRGIQSSGEPTTGLYYDEMPLSGSVGTGNDAGGRTPDIRLFDVERVEVLRGPQGTLYGSGSMGGTVRVIFNKPVQESEAAVSQT